MAGHCRTSRRYCILWYVARPTGVSRLLRRRCSLWSPLLFETDRGEDFDFTVAVTVPEERRLWAAGGHGRGGAAGCGDAAVHRRGEGARADRRYKMLETWIDLGSRRTNSGT